MTTKLSPMGHEFVLAEPGCIVVRSLRRRVTGSWKASSNVSAPLPIPRCAGMLHRDLKTKQGAEFHLSEDIYVVGSAAGISPRLLQQSLMIDRSTNVFIFEFVFW